MENNQPRYSAGIVHLETLNSSLPFHQPNSIAGIGRKPRYPFHRQFNQQVLIPDVFADLRTVPFDIHRRPGPVPRKRPPPSHRRRYHQGRQIPHCSQTGSRALPQSGLFATVTKKYISLKILSAATSLEPKELYILQCITESKIIRKGRNFGIQLLDNFFIDGAKGIHMCLVTAVTGERLARKPVLPYDDLDWPRTIGLQMAQALGFLHTQGITHTGE